MDVEQPAATAVATATTLRQADMTASAGQQTTAVPLTATISMPLFWPSTS